MELSEAFFLRRVHAVVVHDVEAQLGVVSGGATWNFCGTIIDYDAVRVEASSKLKAARNEINIWVMKLQKTQKAAEAALDLYAAKCSR